MHGRKRLMGRWGLRLSWFILSSKYQSMSSFSMPDVGSEEGANKQRPSEEGMVHPQSSFDLDSGHVFFLWLDHFRVHPGHVTRESPREGYDIQLIDSGRHSNGVISSYVPSSHPRTELI